MSNPEFFSRKQISPIFILNNINIKRFTLKSAHRLIKKDKKGHYNTCKITKERPIKRKALGEIDGNNNKRVKRGLES